MKIVVVIPIYKEPELLKNYEVVSISNTLLRLGGKFDILFLGFSQQMFNEYVNYFNIKNLDALAFLEFPRDCFLNIHTYNSMLKEKCFYEKISKYEFLLIVQSDCFIFGDDFTEFLEYDFIGAPWFSNILNPGEKALFTGNGGFSLRNINKCLNVLSTNTSLLSFKELYQLVKPFYNNIPIFMIFWIALWQWVFCNRIKSNKNINYHMYEDVFWSLIVPKRFKDFKIASGDVALKFSFETNPSLCYELNNFQLPVGCHGFNKYEPLFWKKWINFE
jgi:hypothetical protein